MKRDYKKFFETFKELSELATTGLSEEDAFIKTMDKIRKSVVGIEREKELIVEAVNKFKYAKYYFELTEKNLNLLLLQGENIYVNIPEKIAEIKNHLFFCKTRLEEIIGLDEQGEIEDVYNIKAINAFVREEWTSIKNDFEKLNSLLKELNPNLQDINLLLNDNDRRNLRFLFAKLDDCNIAFLYYWSFSNYTSLVSELIARTLLAIKEKQSFEATLLPPIEFSEE